MPRDQSHMMLTRRRQGILRDLYRRHWPELCRYVSRTFGAGPPDPEDVAQTAFSKFAALKDPDSVQNPRAFLITVARNIVLDHYRLHRSHAFHLRQIAEDHETLHAAFDDLTPERVLLAKEELTVLRQVLLRMPEKRRELFLLQRLQGLSYADLSGRTGLSKTTVKYHVAAALADCLCALAELSAVSGKKTGKRSGRKGKKE